MDLCLLEFAQSDQALGTGKFNCKNVKNKKQLNYAILCHQTFCSKL